MTTQRYSVNPHPISSILAWIRDGDVAIPEIQRPFVWDATKVRNLLDSLYEGYPVGYLIAWRNPDVKLKDGRTSHGKRILIDGQQRVTALMAALLGREIVDKDYRRKRIRIAFHPIEKRFEVRNPAIAKSSAWIEDIAEVFADPGIYPVVKRYCERNPEAEEGTIFNELQRLSNITNNHVGIIELDSNLSIETVTEIFIRVNSAGVELSQADFAMSRIASSEQYEGNVLRKAIDYFCHLAVAPEFYDRISKNDTEFASTEFFRKMSWLRSENDDIYDPSYTDMLRVAFTSEFRRGRLQDLVALLSGRNFETKQFEEEIARASFEKLERGIHQFMNETHFKRFVMIIRSAGFIHSSLLGSQNALNFAYILYLTLRDQQMRPEEIEMSVRRWFVMSSLTGRYTGSPETTFDQDIRRITEGDFRTFAETTIAGELSEAYWRELLPQELISSSANSRYFRIFKAAQVKMNDLGFLSRDITVRDLILNRADVHHLYPRNYLKKQGLTQRHYNQIANYALSQTEINIAIGDRRPADYFGHLGEQANGGATKYGAIARPDDLRRNLAMHAIPERILDEEMDYQEFLDERRKLMAEKMRQYFGML